METYLSLVYEQSYLDLYELETAHVPHNLYQTANSRNLYLTLKIYLCQRNPITHPNIYNWARISHVLSFYHWLMLISEMVSICQLLQYTCSGSTGRKYSPLPGWSGGCQHGYSGGCQAGNCTQRTILCKSCSYIISSNTSETESS